MSKGFVFDMDGTLLDTIKFWHEAERQITDEAGVVLTKAERDELNTLTLDEAGAFFHDRFGILGSGSAVAADIVGRMLELYRTGAQANPGALGFVQAVHDAGLPLCVLTSSPVAFMQAGLERAGLKRFFADDMLLSAEDLGMVKRDLATYEYVCRLMGADPASTWLFDDSWYALATAREFGLRTVGVFSNDNCGTHEELACYCEVVVDSFEELDVAEFL